MANNQNQSNTDGATGNEKEKKPRLGDYNSGFYNCSSFAASVNAEELFSEVNKPKLKQYMTAGSMYSRNAAWVPLDVVMPSFMKPNPVFNQPYGNKIHMDKFFPMVLCISKKPLDKHLDFIYDDEGVYDKCERHLMSLASHTMESFPDVEAFMSQPIEKSIENGTDSETGDELLGDDVLVVFLTIFTAIHMIANNDMVLRYTDMTNLEENGGFVTLGSSVPVKKIFSSERNTPPSKKPNPIPWIYSAEEADAKRGTMFRLGCSRLVMSEYRHMLRMLLKFGKGDNKTPFDERDVDDTTFELDLLKTICSGTHPTGPGALGFLGSYMQYICLVSTTAPSERKKEILSDPEVMWNMLVVNYLSDFTASNISHISVNEGGKEAKLKYHIKSLNPLTNLFFTSTKECKTMCAIVLYLTEAVCRVRCNENIVNNVCARSRECESCNSGEQCALNWVNVFTGNASLTSGVTDSKKMAMDGPSSRTLNVALLTEFNSKAMIMGAMSKVADQINPAVNANVPFIRAYLETMKTFENCFENEINALKQANGNDKLKNKQVLDALIKVLDKIKKYVNDGKHMQIIPNRRQFGATRKLECVLTDNEGGVPKISMGLLCFPLSKSKVLIFMARFATYYNLKLDSFVSNTAGCREDCLTAIGKTSIGSYFEKVPQETYQLKVYQIRPYIHPDTQEEHNIGCPPKEDKQCDVTSLWGKAANKFKLLCGTVKGVDDLPNGSSRWSMDIKSQNDSSVVTKDQRGHIATLVNCQIKNECRNFNQTRWVQSMNTIVDDLLSEPLGQFYHKELASLRTFEDLLQHYVMGLLMVANDYIIKPNAHFDGLTVPRFGEIVSHSKLNTDVMNEAFLTGGPALLFTRVEIDTFMATVSNKKQKFIVCVIKELSKTGMFLPHHMQGLLKLSLKGVFVPIKQIYSGGDPNDAVQDTFGKEISVMFNMSPRDMIGHFATKISMFAHKIRENNTLEETDPIDVDMVINLFANYNANTLLDDEFMLEIAKNIEDPVEVAKIESRAREMMEDDEEEGEDVCGVCVVGGGSSGEENSVQAMNKESVEAIEMKLAMLKEIDEC